MIQILESPNSLILLGLWQFVFICRIVSTLTAEGCRSVESQNGVENDYKALKKLDDEIQQVSNTMSTRTS